MEYSYLTVQARGPNLSKQEEEKEVDGPSEDGLLKNRNM
jgi:hypothetical protein